MKLHFYLQNNGDGSASAIVCPDAAAAQAGDESMDEGWGEPSDDSFDLKIEDGKIYVRGYDPDTYKDVWYELTD